MNKPNFDSIAKWYNQTTHLYEWFWYKSSKSYAMHYGYWEKNTKKLDEALINTNKFMAELGKITSKMHILDAGCGVGGSSIWLAKNYHSHVTGITISSIELDKAKYFAQKNKVDHLVNFLKMNYLKTSFQDNSFDIVWAIESVCHADKKEAFLKEAYRILKPGGKIIITDAFLKRVPRTEREKQIVTDFYKGMLLPNLYLVNQFSKAFKQIRYINIHFYNKSKEVIPSSKHIHDSAKLFYPFICILSFLHIVPKILCFNCIAGIVQYEGLMKMDLAAYGTFYAEKPL